MSDAAFPYPPLPVGAVRRIGVGWWGLLSVVVTEGALFAYLLFSYGYYAVQLDPSWMPVRYPKLELSAPNTAILLLSSVAVWWGERSIRRGNRKQALLGIAGGLVLGAIFVGIQWLEWHNKPFGLRTGLYGSLFYTITGFHMAHVLVGLVGLLLALIWTGLGYFDEERNAPIVNVSAYWHFVDAVWLCVFTVLYLTPYLE